jgi:hypothetical protein
VRALAADPFTRNDLGELLSAAGKFELFPEDFLGAERMAESDLAVWLAHPHELRAVPPMLELAARVPVQIGAIDQALYFVFRFRMTPPHFAARHGVMVGVVGPYMVTDNAVTYRSGTAWSDLKPNENRSPQELVARFHESLLQGGLEQSLKAIARSGQP